MKGSEVIFLLATARSPKADSNRLAPQNLSFGCLIYAFEVRYREILCRKYAIIPILQSSSY